MELLNDLGIKYSDLEIYERAFTHASYANEAGIISNERLEYLGDAVLQLIISEYLYQNSDEPEGIMTKKRAHYVCENALYNYGIKLKINEYLRLGKGEIESGGKYKKVIIADALEAFLGAIFLDQGFLVVKDFIYKHIIPIIEDDKDPLSGDYKSELQELVQTDKRSLEYVLVNEVGPAHMKKYTVAVKIDNIIYGKGTASSKKAAEQEAARDALLKSVNSCKKD